jgi:hypothetical protein
VFNPLVSIIEKPKKDIKVFPVPTNDYLFIEAGGSWDNNSISVKIMNLQGQIMISAQKYDLQDEIDINHLRPGVYLLWVSDGDNQAVKKIIKK